MNVFLIKFILIFVMTSLSVVTASVFADNAKKISQGEVLLEKFLTKTKTLEATFQQTLRAHDGEVLQQTEGKFFFDRPGKFRWNYQSPYEQKIISNGKRIWIYDVDLQQVTIQKAAQGLATTPMALLEDSMKLHEAFDVKALDQKEGVYRLKLLSKTKESDFGEIVIGIDSKGLRFMQLHDQFEQVTDIVFSNSFSNKVFPASVFEFIPPKGVDVFGG